MQVRSSLVAPMRVVAFGLAVMALVWAHGASASGPSTGNDAHANVSSPASPQQMSGKDNVMSDIIDIKPLEKIGYDTRMVRYGLIALGVLVLVLLVLYILDILIRKRKKKNQIPAAACPPDELAMKNLNELESMTGIDQKEYYFVLTAILRNYMKGRFGLDAPEMTTEELLPRIASLSLDNRLASQLKELLKTTDPIKFAGVSAGSDKLKHDMTFARSFVETTRAVPEKNEAADKAKDITV